MPDQHADVTELDTCRTAAVRVVVADDLEIVRSGLPMLLDGSPDFVIVGQADSPTSLDVVLEGCPCDLLLLDLHMPDPAAMDGIAMVARLRIHHPALRIVVFTASSSQSLIELALLCGVDGYLNKACFGAELLEGLAAVSVGRCFLCTASQRMLSGGVKKINSVIDNLTQCESEVLRLLHCGLSVTSIAKLRNRTIATVSHQKKSAMRRLGIRFDGELFSLLAQLDGDTCHPSR